MQINYVICVFLTLKFLGRIIIMPICLTHSKKVHQIIAGY